MPQHAERRHVARLSIPAHLSGPAVDEHGVRLLDLSPQGARIEHVRRLPDWSICFLDLPRALGGLRLQGQVIWSQVAGRKTLADGRRVIYYRSGLRFSELTREQDAGLIAALNILKTAQAG
jgi:hypothetical protein